MMFIINDFFSSAHKLKYLYIYSLCYTICSLCSQDGKKTTEEGNTLNTEDTEVGEPRGDVEMAPVYLSRLLPVFCHTFQATMVHTVRKASLSILRKMVHYIPAPLLHQVKLC